MPTATSSEHAQPRLSPPRSPGPPDLRRLTSSGQLTPGARLSPRSSVHLGLSVRGTLSPAASIPSSPTSIHSHSSAIFERDVEPLLSHDGPSPAGAPNPHLLPRGHGTEALEQAVPPALDSAAALLSAPDLGDVAVLAPIARAGSLFAGSSRGASPIRSRSPSPGLGASLAASISGSPPAAGGRPPIYSEVTATQVPRAVPVPQRSTTASTMESRYYSAPSSAAGSPAASPSGLPDATPTANSFFGGSAGGLRAPPSPAQRLSFISYADLVGSVPAADTPLSALTAGASAADPPPHLPGLAPPERGRSGASSVRNSVLFGGAAEGAGGEWEREGMSGGLEERLEALMRGSSPVAGTA